jgi:hypothetical protein
VGNRLNRAEQALATPGSNVKVVRQRDPAALGACVPKRNRSFPQGARNSIKVYPIVGDKDLMANFWLCGHRRVWLASFSSP